LVHVFYYASAFSSFRKNALAQSPNGDAIISTCIFIPVIDVAVEHGTISDCIMTVEEEEDVKGDEEESDDDKEGVSVFIDNVDLFCLCLYKSSTIPSSNDIET
jgi:hypothetical protein